MALCKCVKPDLLLKASTKNYEIYYLETFSHVVKISTITCIIALEARKKWDLQQLGINNAFLLGNLQKKVYMTPSASFPSSRSL